MLLTDPLPVSGLYPVECLTVLAVAAMVGVRWLPQRYRRPVAIGATASSAASAILMLAQGLRWQLLPVLAAAVLVLPTLVSTIIRDPNRTQRRAAWWLALPTTGLLVAVIAIGPLAAWALPVPAFPAPTGPYAVGTAVQHWTDDERPETATAEPDDRREVVTQLWYPASPATGQRAPYLGARREDAERVADALARYSGLPGDSFVLDGLARASTAAVLDAQPVATDKRFPLVLFSPALGSTRGQNTYWATELASRGYVVAALDHPYDSPAVELDDGTVAQSVVVSTGDDALDQRNALGWATVRANDLSFALTRITQSPFAHLLDFDRVAVTGHSLGGGAALMAARADHRFAAVIDIDGFPYDPTPGPFPQPALLVNHPLDPGESPDFLPKARRVLDFAQAGGYRLEVPGTEHLTFTDSPLFLPPLPSLVGDLGRSEGPRLTTEITAAFLDHVLRGEGSEEQLRTELSRRGTLDQHRLS